MDSYKIFSRSTMGLDNRVWRVMIILAFLSTALLSYSVITKDKCVAFTIDIGSKAQKADSFFYTNENIPVIASISNKDITWNFNDYTSSTVKGVSATHKFFTVGKYYVSASIGGNCETGRLITVRNRPVINSDNLVVLAKEIIGNPATIVNKTEEFISPVLADYYEWSVLYHPELGVKNGNNATFQFPNEGDYTLQLTLDHNRIKSYVKQINVDDPGRSTRKKPEDVAPLIPDKLPEIPKKVPGPTIDPGKPIPEPPTPITEIETTPKTIRLADDTFKSYLQALVDEQMSEGDFYRYLCGKGTTPVIVNGNKKKIKTFSWLCGEIRGKKQAKWVVLKKTIKIESAKLTRDEANCVIKIEVDY
ncbi:MAG: hypothetical protein ABJB11_16565 [Ferruginibacter sp.]